MTKEGSPSLANGAEKTHLKEQPLPLPLPVTGGVVGDVGQADIDTTTTHTTLPPLYGPPILPLDNNINEGALAGHSVGALADQLIVIRPTLKRYLILLMYGICSMEKSFQWINLSTITNKVTLYYEVDNMTVNWTSVLFMITFIPLVLPTGWLIERIGLRKAVLIGSTGITLGACIKCFACREDGFWIVIVGQIVVSLSEQFIFCIPARIASVWFPDHQVSLATGFGIFGNQCGIALGFLIPQALLRGMETRDEIGVGLWHLFFWTALVAFVTWLALIILFDDHPEFAPGAARYNKIIGEQAQRDQMLSFPNEMRLFGSILVELMADLNSVFLVIAYGINVGVVYAIQTCLNQMIAGSDWAEANEIVGTAGLIIIFAGMCGALFWGYLCDWSHRYILINRILYVGAIVSIVLFGLALRRVNQEWPLYLASALLGFMLIGYTVAGLDTIVELTYPIPEMVSTSVMNLAPQIFGVAITFLCSTIVDEYKSDMANVFLVACLLVGLVFTLLINERLKRQNQVEETKKQQQQIQLQA
uniref:Feline leukemia virus subgroup C receptor-related protein 2 n=1 Tax=Aceria tosichella TaxID=561515 RepID=A0A6G1SJI3_9ACAR